MSRKIKESIKFYNISEKYDGIIKQLDENWIKCNGNKQKHGKNSC